MFPSQVLPYNVKAYSEYYVDEFISSFTHASLATGQIDRDTGLMLIKKLDDKASHRMPMISFNRAMLTGSQLEGGACSAIAFRVAKEAIAFLNHLRDQSHLKTTSKQLSFALRFGRLIQNFEEMAISKRSLDKTVQTAIRTEQAALNTITVNRQVIRSGNGVAEKVGAMASFYGLKVVESTPEIRVNGNEQLATLLADQIHTLSEGVYLLRIIQEKYNHKLEEKGHSVVYIKSNDLEYIFDPALGAYTLFSESIKTNLLYNALMSANQKFGVDLLSFHKLVGE